MFFSSSDHLLMRYCTVCHIVITIKPHNIFFTNISTEIVYVFSAHFSVGSMGWPFQFMQQVSPSTTNKAFSGQSLMLLLFSFRMAPITAFCVFLISPCFKRKVGSCANSNAEYNSLSLLVYMRSDSLCQR